MSHDDPSDRLPTPPQPDESPVVLVTGGNRGIGRALALEFARTRWRVGVHFHTRKEDADATVDDIASLGGEGFPVQADIRQLKEVRSMVARLVHRWHGLDALVCNAGRASSGHVMRLDPKEWNDTMATNLTGVFHCLQAGTEHMHDKGGSVLIVGSFAGLQGGPGQAAYAASKAGVIGLMKTAANEWGKKNIRVNAVFPGWHQTDMSDGFMPSDEDLADHTLGRTPNLEAVARSIVHLVLQEDISGQVWNLDSRILP